MNKKILSVLLLLFTVLVIVGCTEQDDVPDELQVPEDDALAGQATYRELTANQLAAGIQLDRGWNRFAWPGELDETDVADAVAGLEHVRYVYNFQTRNYWMPEGSPWIQWAQSNGRWFDNLEPNNRYAISMSQREMWSYAVEADGNGCVPTSAKDNTCDNVDDNCNGQIDEGARQVCDTGLLGLCAEGGQTCTDGAWNACEQRKQAQGETCNGVDDDCDGEVDEDEDMCAYDGSCADGSCSEPPLCDFGWQNGCNTHLACPDADNCWTINYDEPVQHTCEGQMYINFTQTDNGWARMEADCSDPVGADLYPADGEFTCRDDIPNCALCGAKICNKDGVLSAATGPNCLDWYNGIDTGEVVEC
ncbi:hypothetical protein CL619_00460 [archaeon]|nr:hypothetical protein [archaeon]